MSCQQWYFCQAFWQWNRSREKLVHTFSPKPLVQSEPQPESQRCSLMWFSMLITVRFQMFLFFNLHHCFKELIAYYSRNFSEIWAKLILIYLGSLLWKLFFSVDMRNKSFFFNYRPTSTDDSLEIKASIKVLAD